MASLPCDTNLRTWKKNDCLNLSTLIQFRVLRSAGDVPLAAQELCGAAALGCGKQRSVKQAQSKVPSGLGY